MEIIFSQQQGRVPVAVFHLKGELTTETSPQLEAQAEQAIRTGTRYLLLDLTEVPYISSYGIRAISQIFTWLGDYSQNQSRETLSRGLRDGTFKSPNLKLVNPSRQVLKVLTTAGIDMFLEIFSDLPTAVASF
jgi:anti-anti-sigma factor